MVSAADIALFLLTASMAAWDAQHKPQMQAQQQGGAQEQQLQQPLHNTRVMVLTGLPNNSSSSPAQAAEQLRQLDDQSAQQIRTMYHALAKKAASLDIPIGEWEWLEGPYTVLAFMFVGLLPLLRLLLSLQAHPEHMLITALDPAAGSSTLSGY
jgi:hypothetical protein